MCGRVALFTPPARLARFLEATLAAGISPETAPNWNLGPQQTLFALRDDQEQRVLEPFFWGLIPPWAKDPAISNNLINARGETVAEKPSFREAFLTRPCVIPVDGFYEWAVHGTAKQPHYFTRRDGNVALFAGLYEFWRNPAMPSAPPRATCTVLTTEPSADIDGVHDRMPVILEPRTVDQWLTPGPSGAAARSELIRSAPAGTLQHLAVRPLVNSVRNNGPELLEPGTEVATRLF